MSDIKGDRLYVNASASQARKRLKGFGHGVRKVRSAGKNQAVIIHTATGRHLEELEAVFSDEMPSRSQEELTMRRDDSAALNSTVRLGCNDLAGSSAWTAKRLPRRAKKKPDRRVARPGEAGSWQEDPFKCR